MEQTIVVEYLPNGLGVLVEEIPLLRSVSLGLWFKHGSRHETDAQAGLSHFIEHLLFKGTRSRTCQQIAEAIDNMGGNLDAFTGREYTSFFAKVLDTQFEEALALLADVIFNPSLHLDDLELEREVILEEIKMIQDSPDESAHELFVKTFFNSHPLGRSILGSSETIQSFNHDDVLNFFSENYKPERLLLAVAGNVRAEDVIEAAGKHLGAVEPGGRILVENAPGYEARTELINREGMEQVHLLMGANAFPKTDKRRYALDTLNIYLGGSVSSRLFQNVRERRGLAYAINSFTSTFKDCGLLGIYAATSTDRVGQLADAVMTEISELAGGRIDELHINRVKSFIKGDVMLGLESTANRMAFLARQMIYFGEIKTMDKVMAELDQVTVEDVVSVAKHVLSGSPLTVTAIGRLNGGREELGRLSPA